MKARKYISLAVLAAFLAATLTIPMPAVGGWTDDWYDQKVSQGPGYFEGQKRGYFQAGSFSARWRQSNDNLMTIQPASIRGGCGGIDLFSGGISFLDFEYLVEKLQKVLQSAAGYAFQIGLKVLCEKCSSALEWVTGITDMLNNMQIDDCKAGKALVATVAKQIKHPKMDKVQGELSNAVNDFTQSSGWDTLYKRTSELLKSGDNKPAVVESQLGGMLEGCPASVKEMFGTAGSMMAKMTGKHGMPAEHAAFFRGLLGDVVIEVQNNLPRARWVDSCIGDTDPLDAIKNGKVQVRTDPSGPCTADANPFGTLSKRVETQMWAIADKMKNKSALTSEEEAFLDSNPLAVQLVLKTAVTTSQEGAMIAVLSDVTAKAYTYMLAGDLYGRIKKAMGAAKAANVAGGTGKPETCKKELLEEIYDMFSDMDEDVNKLVKYTYAAQQVAMAEVGTLYNLVKHYQEFDNLARKQLQSRFGGAVTMRAMAK